MARRKRSDSTDGILAAFSAAFSGPTPPPAHVVVPDYAMPFWNSIVSARAREHWNSSDYEMAANLARCKADIERLQAEIYAEGDVLENAKGTQIMNPKHSLLEVLSRRAVALSRMLHVHAEATVGPATKSVPKAQLQKQAQALATETDDGLIARPLSH